MYKQNKTNKFLPVLDTWGQYFENYDEGLGTLYERFILHKIFVKIHDNFTIKNILEVPTFGMTGISGINSMWWGDQGVDVFYIDNHLKRINLTNRVWQEIGLKGNAVFSCYELLPFRKKSFDLVWNFASLWFVPNLDRFLTDIKEIAKKAILICVPNDKSIGYLLRRKYAQGISQIYLDHIQPDLIKSRMMDDEWELWDEDIFDVPPWPDIPMKKEEFFKIIHMNFIGKWLLKKRSRENVKKNCNILDYFKGNLPDLNKRMKKYSILEKSPKIFTQFWGHHRYFIFYKK